MSNIDLRLKQLKGKVHIAKFSYGGDLYHVESVENDSIENHSRWVLDSIADIHTCKDQAMFTTF